MVSCSLTTCLRNAIFIFLYLHIHEIETAVPIEIITEETNLETLTQSFPHIIPMIPGKEPLIPLRRTAEDILPGNMAEQEPLTDSQNKFKPDSKKLFPISEQILQETNTKKSDETGAIEAVNPENAPEKSYQDAF